MSTPLLRGRHKRRSKLGLLLYACAVLLIGGLVRFTDSWSLTSSLRVGHRLASLVDSTRESILALRCNFWCLQGAQSWPR